MTEAKNPVVIVGAGPVGLTAALLLARYSLPVELVEQHPGTAIHPRARGINYRTMEIFRGLGLEEAIRAGGAALANNRYQLVVESLAGQELRRMDGLSDLDATMAAYTPVRWCLCAQDELEPILLAAAQQQGATIEFNTELIELEQDETGVNLRLKDRENGQERELRAAYVVAADGANSFVRERLGIGRQGRGTQEYYIGIYFRADLSELVQDRLFGMCFINNPQLRATLAAVNNTDRWVLNVPYLPDKGLTPTSFTPEHCRELVRQAVGWPDVEPELLSILPWEAAGLVAERYRQGRVFLAGDAAHVMPPSGAFGLNTGVQDVHNLAWKLALVYKGQVAANLLDSYELERHPVGQLTTEQAIARLDFRARQASPGEDKPKLIDDKVIMLGYRYNTTEIMPEPLELKGQVGSRAPHLWLTTPGGASRSSLDLFEGRFVLVTDATGAAWLETIQTLTARSGLPLVAYRFGLDLPDEGGAWAQTTGLPVGGALLVRPDGFVVWRSDTTVKLEDLPYWQEGGW